MDYRETPQARPTAHEVQEGDAVTIPQARCISILDLGRRGLEFIRCAYGGWQIAKR